MGLHLVDRMAGALVLHAGRHGLKDCLPKFINYVMWRKEAKARTGRFEVALFERPFRADQGRLLREVVEDLVASSNGNAQKSSESDTPHQNGAACCPSRAGCAGGYGVSPRTPLEPSLTRRGAPSFGTSNSGAPQRRPGYC